LTALIRKFSQIAVSLLMCFQHEYSECLLLKSIQLDSCMVSALLWTFAFSLFSSQPICKWKNALMDFLWYL